MAFENPFGNSFENIKKKQNQNQPTPNQVLQQGKGPVKVQTNKVKQAASATSAKKKSSGGGAKKSAYSGSGKKSGVMPLATQDNGLIGANRPVFTPSTIKKNKPVFTPWTVKAQEMKDKEFKQAQRITGISREAFDAVKTREMNRPIHEKMEEDSRNKRVEQILITSPGISAEFMDTHVNGKSNEYVDNKIEELIKEELGDKWYSYYKKREVYDLTIWKLRAAYKAQMRRYYNDKAEKARYNTDEYKDTYSRLVGIEQRMRTDIEKIVNDADRKLEYNHSLVQAYLDGNEYVLNDPYNLARAKELYEKFVEQNKKIEEYRNINATIDRYSMKSAARDENGNIDAERGLTESSYDKERRDLVSATSLIADQMVFKAASGANADKDTRNEARIRNEAYLKGVVSGHNVKAYEKFEKDKDKVYTNTPQGRWRANYNLGDIGIKSNYAGAAAMDALDSGLVADEIYNELAYRIQANNEKVLENKGVISQKWAELAQYAPQAIEQGKYKIAGGIAGVAVGGGLTGGTGLKQGWNVGGSMAVAEFAYRQSAGAAYVRLLRESGLSPEDAAVLAKDEALASSIVEFGLELGTSMMWSGSVKGFEKVTGKKISNTGKGLVKKLISAGMSEKSAMKVVSVATTAGRIAIESASEYGEEWMQTGVSQAVNHHAKDGTTATPFGLLLETLDLSKFSEEELQERNAAGGTGAFLGALGGGGRAVGIGAFNAGVDAGVDAVDTIQTGREHKALGKENVDAIIDRGQHANVNQSARRYADRIADKDNPSAWNVGKQYKYNLRADAEDNATQADLQKRLQTTQAYDLTGDNGEVDIGKRHIRLNLDGTMPEIDTVKHEDTHILERYAPDEHKRFMQFVSEAAAKNDADALEARKEQLRRNGYIVYADEEAKIIDEEATSALIDGELAAELPELFLSHGKTIENLAKRKPNFALKVYDIINGALKGDATATTGGVSLSRADLYEAQQLWAKAIEKAQANIEAGIDPGTDGETKHLYTNKGDEGARARAEQMEQNGASPDEIWTATGWARDLSGQWVTEIDDSTAVYDGSGVVQFKQTPEYERYIKLMSRYETLTDAEKIELNQLDVRFDNALNSRSGKLSEHLHHPELYGRHPELGGYGYNQVDMKNAGNANFDKVNKQINVNKNNPLYQRESSTFHEVQHALQDAEGRPGGSSPEYWQNRGYDKQAAGEMYRNTAGEIEARDAASRINMTAQERRQNFPEAFKQENRDKAVFADGGVSYDVGTGKLKDITFDDIKDIQSIGERKSINSFTPKDIKKTEVFAIKLFKEMGVKSPFFRAQFGDWRVGDKTPVKVLTISKTEEKNPRGTYINKDTGLSITSSSVGYDETISHSGGDKLSVIAMQNIDKIIENSILLDTEVSGYGRGKKSIYTCFMHKFYSPVFINGKPYIAKMAVEESYQPGAKDTNKKFYHVRAIKIEPASSVGIGLNHTPIMDESDSTIMVSQLFEIVKSCDDKFKPNPSSVVVNADGTPKVVYHGTGEEFYIFDKSLQGSNTGAQSAKKAIFFTSSRKVAEGYAKDARPRNITDLYNKAEHLENNAFYTGDYAKAEAAWKEYEDAELEYNGEGKVMSAYLNMKNPLVYDFEGKEYREVTYNDLLKKALKNGNDGVVFLNTYDASNDAHDEMTDVYAVFDSTQVKSATDNIGTFDKTNPDIRYSRKDATDDTATEDGENVSQLFTNTMHKGHYSPEFTAEADTRASDFTYNPISNKETYEGAQAYIDNVGEEKALRELYSRESWSADDTAMSLALIERFNQKKDYSSAVDVFENLRQHATKAGQAIQAISIVNRLTPEGQYMVLNRDNQRMIEQQVEKMPKERQEQFRKEYAEAKAKDREEAAARREKRRLEEEAGRPVFVPSEPEEVKKPSLGDSRNEEQAEKPDISTEEREELDHFFDDLDSDPFGSYVRDAEAEQAARDADDKAAEDYFKQTHVEDLLNLYNIHFINGSRMLELSSALHDIHDMESKTDLITAIRNQSKKRKTVANRFVISALEKQDVTMLKEIAIQQIFGELADTVPETKARKVSTFQAVAQLLNARTMARNVTSNAVFNEVDNLATDSAAVFDCIMGLFTKQRSVAFQRGMFERGTWSAKFDGAIKAYLDKALDVQTSAQGSRYDGLETSRRTFKGRNPMAAAERWMGYGLTVTDEWTKAGIEHNITQSLTRLRDSGKIKMTDEEIKAYAEAVARYRTFQDDTAVSQLLGGLKDTLNIIGVGETRQLGRFKTHEFGLGDIVQKYTRVPGNLISRFLEYSPTGYMKFVYEVGKAAKYVHDGGRFSPEQQRKLAMTLGRAVTGTGFMAAFYMLSKLGIFTGERDDETKEQQELENAEGISSTQLNLSALGRWIGSGFNTDAIEGNKDGDTFVNLAFMEPLNTLMALGYGLHVSEGGGIGDVASVTGKKVFDQVLDMSTMYTMRSMFNTINYGGSGTDVMWDIGASAVTGFVPSMLRQSAEFTDDVDRNPYNEETSVGKALNRVKQTIPGLRQTVPAKVTPFGEERSNKTGNVINDFLNSFASPGSVKQFQTTDVSQELYRLSEINEGVIPSKAPQKFSVSGNSFTLYGKNYEAFAKVYGAKAYNSIKEVVESEYYNQLTDDEKAQAIADVVSKAGTVAKQEWAIGNRLSEDVEVPTDPIEAEASRLDGLSSEKPLSVSSGRYVEYDGQRYELSASQKVKYDKLVSDKTKEYQGYLLDGSRTVENVVGSYKATYYYEDMTEAQRQHYLAEYDKDIRGARKAETRTKYQTNKQRFIDGELSRKIEVTGNYADLPDSIKKQVFNRAEAVAEGDIAQQMKDEIVSGKASEPTDIAQAEERPVFVPSAYTKGGNSSGKSNTSSGGGTARTVSTVASEKPSPTLTSYSEATYASTPTYTRDDYERAYRAYTGARYRTPSFSIERSASITSRYNQYFNDFVMGGKRIEDMLNMPLYVSVDGQTVEVKGDYNSLDDKTKAAVLTALQERAEDEADAMIV